MTIKDIAERCGVSVSTVSRVLNDHPDVSPANRAKVLAVVRETHYVPNSAARDLVRPVSESIGLVVRGVGNPFFTPIIQAVEEACSQAGYTMVLHQIRSGEDELRAGAQLARSKRLRGVIFLGGCFDYSREDVALLDVPFVCCTYTNSFGQLTQEEYSSVTIDDQKEAHRAVAHLLSRGHRRIAVLLDSTHDHSISQLRFLGYQKALEEAGVPLDPALVEEARDFDMAAVYAGMGRLLERRRDFTALFAISDSMAIAAMKALHDHGLEVPRDCSVVAIDGIEMSAYTIPTLTTLGQPQKEMGHQAVSILVDMIQGRGTNRHLLLDATLRVGGSVRSL